MITEVMSSPIGDYSTLIIIQFARKENSDLFQEVDLSFCLCDVSLLLQLVLKLGRNSPQVINHSNNCIADVTLCTVQNPSIHREKKART